VESDGERALIYDHCTAGRTIGVETPAKNQNNLEFKRSSLQVEELELKDGKIVCDRDRYLSKQP